MLAILGGLASYYGVRVFFTLTRSSFDRTLFQDRMSSEFGRLKFSDTDDFTDTMIIAYAYDEKQPRFYSKYYALKDKYLYDIPYY